MYSTASVTAAALDLADDLAVRAANRLDADSADDAVPSMAQLVNGDSAAGSLRGASDSSEAADASVEDPYEV